MSAPVVVTAHFQASLEGLLASPTEVTRLVPIPAGTEKQGALTQ